MSWIGSKDLRLLYVSFATKTWLNSSQCAQVSRGFFRLHHRMITFPHFVCTRDRLDPLNLKLSWVWTFCSRICVFITFRAGQMLRRTREAAAWHQREALRSKLKVGALAVLATAKTKTSTSGSRRHTVNGPPDARIVAEDADASTGSPKNKVWPSDAGNQNTQHCIP